MGNKGKMWRVVSSGMLIIGAVILEGKSSEFFPIKWDVPQGCRCTLSPTLFLIYINGLLCETEKCPVLGVELSENTFFSLLFAGDFVGAAETGLKLQRLIDSVHNYSKHWCLKPM